MRIHGVVDGCKTDAEVRVSNGCSDLHGVQDRQGIWEVGYVPVIVPCTCVPFFNSIVTLSLLSFILFHHTNRP